MPFVSSTNPKAYNGLGKLLAVNAEHGECSIEYFLSPFKEPLIVTVPLETVTSTYPEKHTRAYVKSVEGTWFFGRVIDGEGTIIEIKFADLGIQNYNVSEVYIRCEQAIDDPSPYLAAWINETPLFANARSKFREKIIEQRRACLGMSSILSSVIDLEVHQLKVVRKVLQDPIQRYFLADEVGLGKTIEAGIIIKQYILDNGVKAKKVIIIVPESLLQQWHSELRKRFSLANSSKVILVSMNSISRLEELLDDAGMVVVDEAHHLSANQVLYDIILRQTKSISHLLLLSATPVLRNEKGFLKLLQLLDPKIYSGVTLDKFKERISERQSISEISAGLVPENALIMRDFTDKLISYFQDDETLKFLTKNLSRITMTFPNEDDEEFCSAIEAVRDHLSEVYKLDRRILKNRRSGKHIKTLTPKRAGVKIVRYSSTSFQTLEQEMFKWTNAAALVCDRHEQTGTFSISENIFELYSAVSRFDQDLVEKIISLFPSELPPLDRIRDCANEAINDFNRDEVLYLELEKIFLANEKVVLFCSSNIISQRLFDDIEDKWPGSCAKRAFEESSEEFGVDEELLRFQDKPICRVLICDQRDEEGLNLQGICKTIIHYDSVMSPNRIEQRIGRLDRYGSGEKITSLVLSCKDNPVEEAWVRLLNDGLKVYSQSIASLQYLIDEKVNEIQKKFFSEGVDVINEIINLMVGENGETSRELRNIKQQEQLESMSEEDEGWLEYLYSVDDDWQSFKKSADNWLERCLHIKKQKIDIARLSVPIADAKPFRFQMHIGGQGNVLIPLKHINKYLVDGIDKNAVGISSSNILSNIFTYRRQTALTKAATERGVKLFKFGDQFNSGVEKLTSMDDRGRAFAHWRTYESFSPVEIFEKFIKFEFLIEGDTSEMEKFVGDHLALTRNFSKTALRRKIDGFFKPIWTRLWLDEEYNIVSKSELLSILDKPFVPRTVRNTESTDVHLNAQRILPMHKSGLLHDWSEFVFTARDKASELVLENEEVKKEMAHGLKVGEIHNSKNLSIMRVRNKKIEHESDLDPIELEIKLSEYLLFGITHPKIHLESVGTIFLSNKKYLEAFPRMRQ